MQKILMLKDIPVLRFDLEDYFLEVLEKKLLPFSLRDFVTTTSQDMKKNFKDRATLRDWLSGRVLNLSRRNAKTILNAAGFPQTVRTEDRIKICLACKGLSMSDSYWVRDDVEEFRDVNLRKQTLCDASYQIAILGQHVSATREELRPDLSTGGMFPKFWKRTDFMVELWKNDLTTNFVNTTAEVTVSDLLDQSNVNHLRYRKEQQDSRDFAVCECLADESRSMVAAAEVKDWCIHTGRDFLTWVVRNYEDDFKKMCGTDYVIANVDRHFENFGFWMDNETGKLEGMLPLFDHNQALIADELGTCIDELIYGPLGCFFEDVPDFCRGIDLQIDVSKASEEVKHRYKTLTNTV